MVLREGFRRLLRAGGLAIWAAVGLPILVSQVLQPLPRDEGVLPVAAWSAAYLLFGAAFGLSTARRSGGSRGGTLLLAAGQAAAALALMALPPCFGLEGALLVVVALELGALLPRGPAVAWILTQSAAQLAIMWLHWGWHWSVVLAFAYLPFQLVADATARLLAEESASREELFAANVELVAARQRLAWSTRVEERSRIARDLHDLLGHHLTALSLNLEVARHLASGDVRNRIETAQSVTKLLLGDVREVVGALRQAERFDLSAALTKLAQGVGHPRIHVDVAADLSVDDPGAGEALLRCAQEMVTNAVRHAGAENLWLSVAGSGDGVTIRARDDGRGAAAVSSGHGLSGMRERIEQRGGSFAVETAPGQGFSVTAMLPLPGSPL